MLVWAMSVESRAVEPDVPFSSLHFGPAKMQATTPEGTPCLEAVRNERGRKQVVTRYDWAESGMAKIARPGAARYLRGPFGLCVGGLRTKMVDSDAHRVEIGRFRCDDGRSWSRMRKTTEGHRRNEHRMLLPEQLAAGLHTRQGRLAYRRKLTLVHGICSTSNQFIRVQARLAQDKQVLVSLRECFYSQTVSSGYGTIMGTSSSSGRYGRRTRHVLDSIELL